VTDSDAYLDSESVRDTNERWRVAIHEAGHILLYEICGRPWDSARITIGEEGLDHAGIVDHGEMDDLEAIQLMFDPNRMTKKFFETSAISSAGYVAEKIVRGLTFNGDESTEADEFRGWPGGGQDYLNCVNAWHLGRGRFIGTFEEWIAAAVESARRKLMDWWNLVMRIAARLYRCSSILPSEVADIRKSLQEYS
jgi:hypothetical protein